MIFIRKIDSAYSKNLDADFETEMFDVSNYVGEIRYLSRIDGQNVWWHSERAEAVMFATKAEAKDAVRLYRQTYGDRHSRIDLVR